MRSKYILEINDQSATLEVVGGKGVGKSPNLADSLAYHVEYWRGKARPIEQEDYEYFDPFIGDIGPDYGLQCVT